MKCRPTYHVPRDIVPSRRNQAEEEKAPPEEKPLTKIYKLNENEIVARVSQKIDFKREYHKFPDCRFQREGIAGRPFTRNRSTAFKFVELSPVAQNLLKNYVTERWVTASAPLVGQGPECACPVLLEHLAAQNHHVDLRLEGAPSGVL